ncbi:ester cyclase [Algoriphagus persicinus]|uniref:ester cyclase n=1 Tax=Algoriphagus persicinus TaxID=3108754 RepID=UPI002B3EEED7|nr:ester cyclase [Algoriphagus sp. E1-3-M2]MEB2783028.1 ester cyclase [Algoriphagus sp. E1-3-M2]
MLTTLFVFCSCQSTDKNSILENNKEVVLEYHKVWSEGNMDNLDDILTEDFVCHYLTSVEWKGIEEAKKEISGWRALFPDWHEEIADIIQEKDKVVTRYKATATHTKTYEGIDSTGANIEIYEVSIYRISNGKIAEQWCFPDDSSIKTQILNFKE